MLPDLLWGQHLPGQVVRAVSHTPSPPTFPAFAGLHDDKTDHVLQLLSGHGIPASNLTLFRAHRAVCPRSTCPQPGPAASPSQLPGDRLWVGWVGVTQAVLRTHRLSGCRIDGPAPWSAHQASGPPGMSLGVTPVTAATTLGLCVPGQHTEPGRETLSLQRFTTSPTHFRQIHNSSNGRLKSVPGHFPRITSTLC